MVPGPAAPPPDLFALLSKEPGFRIEGSREALAQYAHVVARLLELGRATCRRRDPALADLSALTRPLRPRALETAQASSTPSRRATGRDLLCLHTAGSDSRQYHHLLADPELRAEWRMTAFDLPAHGRSTPPTGMRRGRVAR